MLILHSPRAGLTEPRVIVALMAQDLNDLRREHRFADFGALGECGWTPRQLVEHAMAARIQAAHCFSETREPGEDRIVIREYDAASPQAAPFETFDRAMRDRLADFEEHSGCIRPGCPAPALDGEA